MSKKDGRSDVSRRRFITGMTAGIVGASVVQGVAQSAILRDEDFDLDVRLSKPKAPEQKLAEEEASVHSCAVSCGGSCHTCGSTCSDTCGSSCGGTCGGTCVTCGGDSCNPSCQNACPAPTERGCPPPSPE